MDPRTFLRIEGLAVFGLALGSYFALDGPIWLLIVLALAPDLSMGGYFVNPRFGSLTYNVIHTYGLPLGLGGFGIWADARFAILVSLVWAGHIGADRTVGYGLKFDSGFKNTHLSTQPVPLSSVTEGDR